MRDDIDYTEADRFANMDTAERAVAMADAGVGDPWELLGFFREKARQAEVERDIATEANIDLARRLREK